MCNINFKILFILCFSFLFSGVKINIVENNKDFVIVDYEIDGFSSNLVSFKNELFIDITLRPINDLLRIRDVRDKINNYPLVRPNFNNEYMAMYRFLNTPPSEELKREDYGDLRSVWNADVHLISTYAFLSDEESRINKKKEKL